MDDGDYLESLEPESRPPVIERARADLAAGRPWIAANRLQSHLAADPFDAESRELLVEVWLGMDDLVAAGRVAIATEREDSAVLDAIVAWRAELERAPGAESRRLRSQGFLNAEVIDALGAVGRARVESLAARAREELGPFEERTFTGEKERFVSVASVGCSIGCLGIIVVFVAGVVQVAHWVGL